MSDTRAIKPEDNKGGTFTQQLDVAEVTTAYVSPVPAEAPGVITAEPGTVKEEAIYFKSKDAGAGTISGLTRDYTNLNGGVGQEHANSEDWEVFQSAFYVKNLVDILLEGFFREQNTVARVDDDNFTVLGNVAIFYTAGRLIRFNGDNDEIASVVSSSYSAGTGLTTVVTAAAVPATLTYVELGLQPKTAAYLSSAFLTAIATLTNKTLVDPAIKTGDATTNPWKTITMMPGFIKPTTTAGCADPEKIEAGTNDIDYDVLDFDKTTDENAYCNLQMPQSWDAGVVQFRYIWTAAAGTAAQNVVLEMSGRSFADDDAIDQAVGTPVEVSDALIATGDVHISAWSGDVTLTGAGKGEYVHLEFMRDISEDNLDADARIIAIQVRYKQDAITD